MTAKVALYLDSIELPKARILRREVYVVGLAAAASSVPALDFQTAPVSVRPGSAARLNDGSGVPLYGPASPGDHLTVRLAIMESDAGQRRVGEILSASRQILAGTKLGATIAAAVGLGSSGAAVAALGEAVDLVADRLKAAGDDHVGSATLTLTLPPGGAWGAGQVKDWTMQAGRAVVTLRLEVEEDGAGETAAATVEQHPEHPEPVEPPAEPPSRRRRPRPETVPADEQGKETA